MKYGDMRPCEEEFMDGLLSAIKIQFGSVSFLEIGVLSGNTVRGVVHRCFDIDCPIKAAGVDFEQWRPNPTPCADYQFYAGDSMDAWRDIRSYRANLLLIDGCHCVNHSMCDFLNYSPFVVQGGWVLFHDTALPEGRDEQDLHPQNHAYAGQPGTGRRCATELGVASSRTTYQSSFAKPYA